MRITSSLRAKGFFGRSLDEFKRASAIALTGAGIRHASAPYILKSFHESDAIEDVKVMSDKDIGGYSTAHLDYIPPPVEATETTTTSQNNSGHVRFHGVISTKLPKDRPNIERSGFAAWRTLDRGSTIFGRTVWDIDPYTYLALRIKSDGRKYFVNIQTDSIVPTDIHQHRLYARRPGEWETVLIKWNEFVRTNHGVVVEPQNELLRQKVRTLGIGLIDRVEGPYDLSIERMWASNRLGEELKQEDDRVEEGQLKSKHGEKIKWNN